MLPDFQILFNNYVTNKSNSFPSGVELAHPGPRPPDLSDSLNYTFLQGNELQLLLLDPATGELQQAGLDSNRPLEALMEVSVSSGGLRGPASTLLPLGSGKGLPGAAWQAGAPSGRAQASLWGSVALGWMVGYRSQEAGHTAALTEFAGSRPGHLQVQARGFLGVSQRAWLPELCY